MKKTKKVKINRKRRKTQKHIQKHKQTGGGFSFTGVLASVILSVGSIMGLKQSGMF
jgi:hypothetical protein